MLFSVYVPTLSNLARDFLIEVSDLAYPKIWRQILRNILRKPCFMQYVPR